MENRSESGQAEKFQMSVGEAVKYIDKCEKAVQGIARDFIREQRNLYQIYAIDDRILSREEAEIYHKQVVRSSMDVPYRAKLLMQVTEELVQLKILVSEACGKMGIKYNQNIFLKILEGEYGEMISDTMEEKKAGISRLSRCDSVKTENLMQSSSHMSPKDEILEYQYPVIRTKKLLVDQALAGRIASNRCRHSRERNCMVKEQMNHIFVDYIPRFDIHTDWHSWTVEM